MGYFTLSVCLSAFALFLVEPLIGKTLLPWFGGSAAVWTSALLFFQLLLTGGYAYSAWVSRGRRRLILHLGLLAGSLALMFLLSLKWRSPIQPPGDLGLARAASPQAGVFLLLLISVGAPFFLLASNSTLAQAWSQRAFPEGNATRLYALSNALSLIALLVYPILIEPNLTLPQQGWGWTGVYGLFAGITAVWVTRALRQRAPQEERTGTAAKPSRRDYLLWVGLSAGATMLLLSVTNYLTQQVAVVPFLWVVPLALYLFSFVLTFAGEKWYPRQAFIYALVPVILIYDLAMQNGARLGVPLQVVIFGLVLFLGCMVCNGELYRLRPEPERMPAFYLILSAGGALGGVLINFAAPVLFKGYWELPLSVLLFCSLFLYMGRSQKEEGLKGEIIQRVSITLLGAGVLITLVRLFMFVSGDLNTAVETRRDFYGVLRVRQIGEQGSIDQSYELINGNTIHGAQFPGPEERLIPTVYYGPTSGVGLALTAFPREGRTLRVGALGLGVGTIATYGEAGDLYRFYELNPEDIRLAEGEGGYFTFLRDSKATIEVVPGDARLSLQREADEGQEGTYNVLVVDVFTGDAIPVHLLDEQAFALYLQRLAPGGILAMHITNGYLDLVPVVWELADHFQLARAVIEDAGDGHYTSASTWVLMAREATLLSRPEISGRARDMREYTTSIRMWTDDYSNLFQLLKH